MTVKNIQKIWKYDEKKKWNKIIVIVGDLDLGRPIVTPFDCRAENPNQFLIPLVVNGDWDLFVMEKFETKDYWGRLS